MASGESFANKHPNFKWIEHVPSPIIVKLYWHLQYLVDMRGVARPQQCGWGHTDAEGNTCHNSMKESVIFSINTVWQSSAILLRSCRACLCLTRIMLAHHTHNIIQGHQRILSNSRSLDIDYVERKYTFWTIVPHLHIQHFVYRYHTWHNVEKWMS